MLQSEVILEVGACGGCVQLRGIPLEDDSWTFLVKRDESTVLGMLPEEEQLGLDAKDQSDRVNSFEEALTLFDQYPWHRLFPVQIHPEFRERIYQIVKQRQESESCERRKDLADWEYLCGKCVE